MNEKSPPVSRIAIPGGIRLLIHAVNGSNTFD